MNKINGELIRENRDEDNQANLLSCSGIYLCIEDEQIFQTKKCNKKISLSKTMYSDRSKTCTTFDNTII